MYWVLSRVRVQIVKPKNPSISIGRSPLIIRDHWIQAGFPAPLLSDVLFANGTTATVAPSPDDDPTQQFVSHMLTKNLSRIRELERDFLDETFRELWDVHKRINRRIHLPYAIDPEADLEKLGHVQVYRIDEMLVSLLHWKHSTRTK